MMANHEDYLDALTAFSRDGSKQIPTVLEQYLNGVAKNGETLFQWPLLKPLIVSKMEQVIEELQQGLSSENITSRPNVENIRFDVMRTRIMDAVHRFTGAPFTIQRLCELLIDPRRHYKRSDKFMRGLEKNVLVVSTVDPFGRKVVSESGSKHLVNGLDNGSPFFPRDSSLSSNLPPVPGWVTTAATNTTVANPRSPQDSTEKADVVSTNGVSSSLTSSVFGDQGDQPPAVHAEEVVETAVSVEASEAGPEATGAGEAMADDEEEEMGTEDTNASSSSSSSSSSEDLSSSDTGENAATSVSPVSSVAPAVTSSSSCEASVARPWASIAAEGEKLQEESHESVAGISKSPPPSGHEDSPSPMDTVEPSDSSHTELSPPSAEKTVGPEPEAAAPSQQETSLNTCEAATESSGQDKQDIPSSSSTSSSSSSPSLSCGTEAEPALSYAEVVSGGKQFSADASPCASEVSSSQPAPTTAPSPPQQQQQQSEIHVEVDEGDEPQAKHRKLDQEESDSSSAQDSEPSSSSVSVAAEESGEKDVTATGTSEEDMSTTADSTMTTATVDAMGAGDGCTADPQPCQEASVDPCPGGDTTHDKNLTPLDSVSESTSSTAEQGEAMEQE